jgi:hypothetical protein
MTERQEATDPPTTLLGLGPPELPEPSIVVNLAKADTKDASVVTVRAWSTSRSDYDALTSGPYDDDVDALAFAARPARRAVALAALGALAFAGAFALTSSFRHSRAPATAAHALTAPRTASTAPKTTVLVGGPWVVRAGEAAEEVQGEVPEVPRASGVPEYLVRSATGSDAPARRTWSATGSVRAAILPPASAHGPTVISEPSEGAPASDKDRIRAVADAVELEDDDGT